MRTIIILTAVAMAMACTSMKPESTEQAAGRPVWADAAAATAVDALVEMYGEGVRERAERGTHQVLEFWRDSDGNADKFQAFVVRQFAGDQETLDTIFERSQWLLEQLNGHLNEITLAFRRQTDLDIGPILPLDEIYAGYDIGAHVGDDMFENKIAFVVLLNFPLTTLEQRLTDGNDWSRRQWAEARLAQRFGRRVPAEVNQALAEASAVADQYIAGYNIWMYHLVDENGERAFPPKMRLLSHWNLRDEIKSQYGNGEEGLPQQRTIQKVMEAIVLQTIPEVVIDNPHVDWNPWTNEVTEAAKNDVDEAAPMDLEISNAPEPDTRYAVLLGDFHASQKLDAYSPTAPTLIERRFNEDREIPEEKVEAMFDALLSSPYLAQVGAIISDRLGRPLEPFDIWYPGFTPRPAMSQAELDAIVMKRYPTPEAYEKDMPRLLRDLGFAPDRANFLAGNIVVDPARGSGHAWGAQMRSAKSHLRTRVGPDGMDYKGFNIAVHEMGHNVEQTLSLNNIDYTLLEGVPNTAFTEALAFVFQDRDLELLGLSVDDPQAEAMTALGDYWATCEIAAVGLVDMKVWHWMYANPDATPAQLKEATVGIAKDVWNQYYAPVFGTEDVVLLGVYSHMIHSFLYLPDYPIGHMIAQQVEESMKRAGRLGPEFERVATIGNVTPDLWMRQASGRPVGADAMLAATGRALDGMNAMGGGR